MERGERITIADLELRHFREHLVWRWVGEYDNRGNEVLEPVTLIEGDTVPPTIGEAWCFCTCHFANSEAHPACVMCRGDSGEDPIHCSVWSGDRFLPLILPPAPPHVIEKVGPQTFRKAFGLPLDRIFPIEVVVVPSFAVLPARRSVRFDVSGKI